MQIAIAIPTYNERSNIVRLISQIRQATENVIISYSALSNGSINGERNFIHIVVVDDNSPDGTRDAILALSEKDNHIHLINRPSKMGLGSAYKDAFEWINNNINAKIIIEMDADLSHPPTLLTKMIELVAAGSVDVVIGSRYFDKGGIQNWPIHRRMISKGANWLAKLVLGIKVNDVTSGYRAYNVSSIQDFLSTNLSSGSSGYDFQIEVLYILSRLNKKIVELPFIFANRTEGRSKLGSKDIIHFASTVFKLRLSRVTKNNRGSASDMS